MPFGFSNCRVLDILSGYDSKIVPAGRESYFEKTSQKTNKN
jgi:hypothetical protein